MELPRYTCLSHCFLNRLCKFVAVFVTEYLFNGVC